MTEKEDSPVFPTSLPDGHYAAIGRVAEAWAVFELSIDDACWGLAGLSPTVGVCLTAQVAGHARKLDAFTALVRLRGGGDPLIKAINKFAERARSLAEQRNRVVHDPWIPLGVLDTPHRIEASARRVAILKLIPMLTDEVLKVADQIADLEADFRALRDRVHRLPPYV
jgi:hypothetical protein